MPDVNVLSRVEDLEADVAALKTDVAELKTDVAELKTDVAVLKSDVAEIKTDLVHLPDEMRKIVSDALVRYDDDSYSLDDDGTSECDSLLERSQDDRRTLESSRPRSRTHMSPLGRLKLASVGLGIARASLASALETRDGFEANARLHQVVVHVSALLDVTAAAVQSHPSIGRVGALGKDVYFKRVSKWLDIERSMKNDDGGMVALLGAASDLTNASVGGVPFFDVVNACKHESSVLVPAKYMPCYEPTIEAAKNVAEELETVLDLTDAAIAAASRLAERP
jgi:regulator of replication initiation timing